MKGLIKQFIWETREVLKNNDIPTIMGEIVILILVICLIAGLLDW